LGHPSSRQGRKCTGHPDPAHSCWTINRRATEKAAVDARPDAAEYARRWRRYCRKRSLSLLPVPTASQSVVQQKTLTSDVARCWAVELWRASYQNRGQIVVGHSIDVNAQFADQE